MIVIETQGHSGGIALLWRYKEEVELSSYRKNHIDVVISTKVGKKFGLSGTYGEPNRSKREETRNLIRTLVVNNTLHWCLIGNMNNVLSQNDKGGRPYPQWLIDGFQVVINDCNLIDMNMLGYRFTWEREFGTDE